ncbi:MAG: electron transfer flavoprotein subunit alpha/FixB family protein, partial [Alphaproteobacteria bacterium]|nr:electron transfer flavoprotein subunit alpha/FixB family protein [Alphaproteobacteria bacterium]
MAVLVIADHDNAELNPATLKTIAAARQIETDVHVLVAGTDCEAVAQQAAKAEGVTQVLLADNPALEHHLAENLAPLVAEGAEGYSHVFAAASTTGKDVMPRVAALLDVAQISDIISVE